MGYDSTEMSNSELRNTRAYRILIKSYNQLITPE
jgi:hypothetical protein